MRRLSRFADLASIPMDNALLYTNVQRELAERKRAEKEVEKTNRRLIKEMRGRGEFSEIPVVMMTSLEDDQEKEMAAKNGANSYTVKPKDPFEFMKTVMEATDYWIKIHRRPERAGETGLVEKRKRGRTKEAQARENRKAIVILE